MALLTSATKGSDHIATISTRNWIKNFIIPLNLCPFASNVFKSDQIEYKVVHGNNSEKHLYELFECFQRLDNDDNIETSLLIFCNAYFHFDTYLLILDAANQLIEDLGYEGIYQIASFHPDYCFEGVDPDDASNYTNRSPFPTLHILRESSVEKAIASYRDVELVPEANIKRLRKLGEEKIRQILFKSYGQV